MCWFHISHQFLMFFLFIFILKLIFSHTTSYSLIVNHHSCLPPSELYFCYHQTFIALTIFETFLFISLPHKLSWTYPASVFLHAPGLLFYLGRYPNACRWWYHPPIWSNLSCIQAIISHFVPIPFIHTLKISIIPHANTLVELSSSRFIKLFDS